LLTCKQFLDELSEYLDQNLAPDERAKLERHISECPNCWVISNTTRRTIQIFRGMEPVPVPGDVQERLMAALERKMAAKRP
jgi:anti-sigma factor RsiW